MIAIKTAGPERLTFVHQINTVELAVSHRGSEIEVKKCHTCRYIGYFSCSPSVLCLSRFERSGYDDAIVTIGYRYTVFSILHDAALRDKSSHLSGHRSHGGNFFLRLSRSIIFSPLTRSTVYRRSLSQSPSTTVPLRSQRSGCSLALSFSRLAPPL